MARASTVLTPWNNDTPLTGVMDLNVVQRGTHRLKVIGSYTKPGPDTGAQDRLLPVSQFTSSVRPGMFHESGSVTATNGAASAWNLVRATAGYRRNLAQIVPTGAVNARDKPMRLLAFQGGQELLSPVSRAVAAAEPSTITDRGYYPFGWIRPPVRPGGTPTGGGAPVNPPTPPLVKDPPGVNWGLPAGPPTIDPVGTPGNPYPPDPNLGLLASLFGGGGATTIPDQGVPVQQAPATGGSTNGLVVLGALAGIAGLGYLWWSKHHKRAT